MRRLLPLAPALLLAACATAPASPPATASSVEARAPVTILVSIDGFRPDYLDRGATPALSSLAAGGVTGPMRPSFPTKTFPNHWTLVTGLVPDRHGVVGNVMEDAGRPGETFTMATEDPFWWNAAEPIWVTAERAGIRTATEFWPGASVGWGGTMNKARHNEVTGGTRPADWHAFAQAVTADQRVGAVVDWMRRPAATRPRLVTLYFDDVDSAGHDGGPDAPEVAVALAKVDAAIGRLVADLRALGQSANIVVVSDHGMAPTSSDRVIALDRLAPPADYRVVESGPYATIVPVSGREAAVSKALVRPHPHMTCWNKADIPARFRFGRNPRVAPILCLAETGWLAMKTAPTSAFRGGNHGYDDRAPEMRALVVANGPAFRPGIRLAEFPNTDVAPLLRTLLDLPPGQGLDGDDAPFKDALRR